MTLNIVTSTVAADLQDSPTQQPSSPCVPPVIVVQSPPVSSPNSPGNGHSHCGGANSDTSAGSLLPLILNADAHSCDLGSRPSTALSDLEEESSDIGSPAWLQPFTILGTKNYIFPALGLYTMHGFQIICFVCWTKSRYGARWYAITGICVRVCTHVSSIYHMSQRPLVEIFQYSFCSQCVPHTVFHSLMWLLLVSVHRNITCSLHMFCTYIVVAVR